eukprot:UN30007
METENEMYSQINTMLKNGLKMGPRAKSRSPPPVTDTSTKTDDTNTKQQIKDNTTQTKNSTMNSTNTNTLTNKLTQSYPTFGYMHNIHRLATPLDTRFASPLQLQQNKVLLDRKQLRLLAIKRQKIQQSAQEMQKQKQ